MGRRTGDNRGMSTGQATSARSETRQRRTRQGTGELPPGRYLDREESWLRFNQRVLELAEDETLPLLERVRFLVHLREQPR